MTDLNIILTYGPVMSNSKLLSDIMSIVNEVARMLGPTWSESVYKKLLSAKLTEHGIENIMEKKIDIYLRDVPGCADDLHSDLLLTTLREDIFIPNNGDGIILELKHIVNNSFKKEYGEQIKEYMRFDRDARTGLVVLFKKVYNSCPATVEEIEFYMPTCLYIDNV